MNDLQIDDIKTDENAAMVLLVDDQAMIEASKLVVGRGLSVRQTEELVRRLNTPAPPKSIGEDDLSNTPESRALENRLREFLGTKVNLYRTRKGGRIVIHFYSEEELADLYDKLIDEPL